MNTTEPDLAAILEQAAGIIMVLGGERLCWANARARALLQIVPNAPFSSLLAAPDHPPWPVELRQLLGVSGEEARCIIDSLGLRQRDGTVLWVKGWASRFVGAHNPDPGVLLVLQERGALSATETRLRLSAKVFECSGEAIMITDTGDYILAVNDAFTRLTGYSIEEVRGRKPAFLSAGRQQAGFFASMWDAVHRDGHWKGEVWHRKKSGEIFPEWCAITAVRNDDGHIDHYITIFSDITERKAEEEHIRHLAQHDFLTGLPNRVLLQDRFEQAVALVNRGRAHPIAILFIDLDGFKPINDRFGHEVGDKLLQEVALRLTRCVRDTDTVCRHGGDEFIVMLPDVLSVDCVPGVTEKILQALQQPCEIEGHTLQLTASIGAALYPLHGESLADVMGCADSAMYSAKHAGKNGWQLANRSCPDS